MGRQKTNMNRRKFLVSSVLAGGGLVIGSTYLTGCKTEAKEAVLQMPDEWFDINPYLQIGDNGVTTIFIPNPEFGQNIKTSMPMLIAEELDADWDRVIVKQAPYHETDYGMQFTGGSMGIMTRWDTLRQVGASARYMLIAAAAQEWEVDAAEITTEAGMLYHKASGRSAGYGEFASKAGAIEIPDSFPVKDVKDFDIIGKPRLNVDGPDIVTGKVEFGLDYYEQGMMHAMVVHPPSFGMTLDSFDAAEAKTMPGISDVFAINTYVDGYKKGGFDANAFPEVIAVVGNSTWEIMQARKKLNVNWKEIETYDEIVVGWRGDESVNIVPAGLESSSGHEADQDSMKSKPETKRRDGNPERAFANAETILERTYTAPFLAHNCMEPINAFASVTGDKVRISAPIQGPMAVIPALVSSLGIPKENIDIDMARMGGGFGRKMYAHYVVEAALISQKINSPVKLTYSREDDMSQGIYRPTYQATYRAAIDDNNELTAIHIIAGGIPESPLFANRFPAGCVDNYLAEDWSVDSNITIGAFRAPRSNFMAGAEQSFLDELAETLGKDPIDFRVELFQRAIDNPVGERNDYDAARYAGVLNLVREKSNWDNIKSNKNVGVAAYLCHNSYVAHVFEVNVVDNKPVVDNVFSAVDCGIVVNPEGATNMVEGGVVDAIGCALYGELTFENGRPIQTNFDKYRMIRMGEAPKNINVSFVESDVKPTGLGEPPFPPAFGALANALYKATGRRFYDQPFKT